MRPPIPDDEEARIRALHALSVLDTEPEVDFDDIVSLATEICGAPVSLVTLVDAQRQWFKAKIGIDAEETGRDVSFCAHAIMGRDLMVIPDATADLRFADNPAVTAVGGIRFYAGAPLIAVDGYALGTLCVVDHSPHRLTIDQLRALRALARQVSGHLELRRLVVVAGVSPVGSLREVDLSYLAQNQVADLRPIADARNTAVTLVATQPALLDADPVRLAQAIDYVLLTALKAVPAGGRVAVRVTARVPATTASGSGSPAVASLEIAHAGGSVVPGWLADLAGGRTAVEPVPRAVAAVLRAHGAEVEIVSGAVTSTGATFRLAFPRAGDLATR